MGGPPSLTSLGNPFRYVNLFGTLHMTCALIVICLCVKGGYGPLEKLHLAPFYLSVSIYFILVSNCSHFQEISNGLFDKGIARYHCIMADMTPLWVSYIKSLTASYVTVMTNLVEQFLFTTKVSHQQTFCRSPVNQLLIKNVLTSSTGQHLRSKAQGVHL